MGLYGSVGAHVKTGKSPMAQDHFKTPPDPKKGHGMTKNLQKSKKKSFGVGQDPNASMIQTLVQQTKLTRLQVTRQHVSWRMALPLL